MSKNRLEPITGCGILGILKCIAGMHGVLPLIHGPLSCSSGHRLAMLYADVEPLLPTTCIVENEFVNGTTSKLSDALNEINRQFNPNLIVVILTCATVMSGEDYESITANFMQKSGKKVLVLDGSGFVCDEVEIAYTTFKEISNLYGLKQNTNAQDIVLEGLAITDYNFSYDYLQLKQLLKDELNVNLKDGLFSGLNINNVDEYNLCQKYYVGLLSNLASNLQAPYGLNGTYNFLTTLSPSQERTNDVLKKHQAKKNELAKKIKKIQDANIVVGIEGSGWQSYSLSKFLKTELNCKVVLSVTNTLNSIDYNDICDAFFYDVGRFELVLYFTQHKVQLVFGSSNVQSDNQWAYIPFYQPVWRVVENEHCLYGYEGANFIINKLYELTSKRTNA